MADSISSFDSAIDHAVTIVERAAQLAARPSYVIDLRRSLRDAGVLSAVDQHDTPALFNWLMSIMSYQGIANSVVESFLREHGNVRYSEIENSLAHHPSCPKLAGHWHFDGCSYQKSSQTCAEPAHFSACPLPWHDLRNGNLNQTAYSLFLFIRDVADGDFVTWIDRQLLAATHSDRANQASAWRDAIVEPMRSIYGVSHKVVVMTLAALMIGVGSRRPIWFKVGTSFVVIDTLVHNFLHRTGILHRFTAEHPYGLGCYRAGGCADILQLVAERIDAARFNPAFPNVFPRFVQNALWRYCASEGLDICNGNRINDESRCDNRYCRLYQRCDREILKKQPKTALLHHSMI